MQISTNFITFCFHLRYCLLTQLMIFGFALSSAECHVRADHLTSRVVMTSVRYELIQDIINNIMERIIIVEDLNNLTTKRPLNSVRRHITEISTRKSSKTPANTANVSRLMSITVFFIVATIECAYCESPIEAEIQSWKSDLRRDEPVTVFHASQSTNINNIPINSNVVRRQVHSNTVNNGSNTDINVNRLRRQGYLDYGRQPPSGPPPPAPSFSVLQPGPSYQQQPLSYNSQNQQQQFAQHQPQSAPSQSQLGAPPPRPPLATPPRYNPQQQPPPQQQGNNRIIPYQGGTQLVGGPQPLSPAPQRTSQRSGSVATPKTQSPGGYANLQPQGAPAHAYYYPPRMPLPLPTCFHNPTGYACCNPMLNDLMVETYTELEARPKFHTCNINAIATMLQHRAEERFNTSFETVAGFEDFAQKIHFNGDLVCKVELGGKYMLAYGSVRDVAANFIPPDDDSQTSGDNNGQNSVPKSGSNAAALVGNNQRQKRTIGPEPEPALNHISRKYTMWI